MQAHLTKATSPVTYLLKMQSRAPWPLLSELTELCWERGWFGVPAVWNDCRRVWIMLEQTEMSVTLSWVLSATVFYDESQSCRKEALCNRGKARSCFSKLIKEQVWHREAFYQRNCSRQRTAPAYSGKLHWRSFWSWPIKGADQLKCIAILYGHLQSVLS